MENLRNKLKDCQPYFIEKELLPNLYFKEDENDTEYWIFKYSFITRLSTLATGVRLGYSRQHILVKLKKIIKANKALIEDFLQRHSE